VADEDIPVPEAPAKSGGGAGKMILIVLIVLLSNAAGAGVTWFLVGRQAVQAQPHAEGEEAKEDIADMLEKGAVVPLEPFVVNLADVDAARYLRIKVSLMVDDKTKIGEVNENQALQLKVRDVILQTLTKKTSQDLINDEGKNHLRQEIQEQVQHFFKEPKLMDVMFTEFVIQL
jgi:flagellar protein FliL